ncbi:MAG TPA: hypothetical protein VFG79_12860 [Solirubrobacter sp.]|nr:hypothetical protein [Solirubrobacter sp.]
MRKTFLVAGVAALAFGATGVAQAQAPAPSIDATASVSPSKAGSKKKPKSEKFKLSVKNDPASKTTASAIEIKFPKTLKISTKKLPQCKKSDTALLAGPKKVCKKSIAGSGSASALLNPFSATPAPLEFDVTPVVGKNQLLFYLEQKGGAVKAVLHGKIKGRKMKIEIPGFLQQPAPMTFSALNELSTTISFKKKKRGLITSTGCKGKKHKIGVTVDYVPNPGPPAASSASDTADAKCK